MIRKFDGSAVPRHFVFVLADGTFVVQWDDNRVQELLTGRYRTFNDEDDFGHAITDYELDQLKNAGRVEHYNRQYVWLYALPEKRRYAKQMRTQERTRNRVRSYYLNTTLPSSQLSNIEALLEDLELSNEFLARNRNNLIAILGKDGTPFASLQDAEAAQVRLSQKAPNVFNNIAVAFIETSTNSNRTTSSTSNAASDSPDLMTIIASQTDKTVTRGKRAILVVSHQHEQKAIHDLLIDMAFEVKTTSSAGRTLTLIEDFSPNLLVMDLDLPDMHGWEMLAKMRENMVPGSLIITVIADPSSSGQNQAMAVSVAKVDIFLERPISIAGLRQKIWFTFKNLQTPIVRRLSG
ncbi:MAG: response regulator [Chloroflexi bacterium]|nr:MAG: hypothetical protein CUN54_04890 [Phototrophicales bacterium]RMF82501.1 MAG: response regulator [Chloroflexota bacterium]